jgi:hypothetical protein
LAKNRNEATSLKTVNEFYELLEGKIKELGKNALKKV